MKGRRMDKEGVVVDNRLQLEHINPKIEGDNYLSTEAIKEVLRDFGTAEKNDKNLWLNITGGNKMHKWIPDLHDVGKHDALK
jgi:hypothetical protein